MRIRTVVPVLSVLAASTLLPLTVLAQPAHAYATIEGSGSTSTAVMLEQWIADESSNGIQVVYQPEGSAAGRSRFADGTTDVAVTDVPLGATGETIDRPHAELPLVSTGTALAYHLTVGGDRITNLRLSPATLAGIFTGTITTWADPAITADNNGRAFPDEPVVPVVHADGAGSTYSFTGWLAHRAPAAWQTWSGGTGATALYPTNGDPGFRAEAGSDAVMNTVQGPDGEGTIAYVENQYAEAARAPVAKVLNPGGYYTTPTRYSVAIAAREATVADDGTVDLTTAYDAADVRAYPIPALSYALIPTSPTDARMTTDKRQTLLDFLAHDECAGQSETGPYDYAPLPLELVRPAMTAIRQLASADPGVDATAADVTRCANPTFDPADLDRDVLGAEAPMPDACDAVDAGPCGDQVGTTPPSPVRAHWQARLSAPRRDGLFVIRPHHRYTLTVLTTDRRKPRILALRPYGKPFVGHGRGLHPAGNVGGRHRWRITTSFAAGRHGTWRVGVAIGDAERGVPVRYYEAPPTGHSAG